MNLFFRG